jgi:amidohydrolase
MHKTLVNQIKNDAFEMKASLVSWRRHLHENPELSFQEYKTSAFIQSVLHDLGVDFTAGIADTGVVAEIKGQHPESRTFALRGDMDALPILEANQVPYCSKNSGVMHACGHDVHTTALLGAAALLKKHADKFQGTARLIFQPGEERLPGGASLMIKEGVLQHPVPTHIIGQHVMPQLPVGKLGFRSGMYMASADELTMIVRGKGGHAAAPHMNIDTVAVSCQIIISLQQLVSRMANPAIPSVLSFGRIIADGTFNVIPNTVEVLGTFRTLDEKWRSEAHLAMTKIAEMTAASFGATVDFQINKGYPFLKNDETLTARMKELAIAYVGEENVVDLDLWMAAEDFAWYTQEIPGSFYRLGVRNEEKGITSAVHTPTFDIDEDALPLGAGFMAFAAMNS